MFVTILGLILLTILGAFIAYFGDLQGRRWGKKRVSWFGLRPKHTAILITSITGAVIALGSVGIVMLTVPSVRNIVLRGENAIYENRRLRAESEASLRQIRSELETAQLRYKEAHAQSQTVANENKRLEKENVAIVQKNQLRQKEQFALQRQYKTLEQNRNTLEDIISQKRRALVELEKQNRNSEVINKDLGRQTTQLTRQNDTLTRTNEDLREKNEALGKEYDELKIRYADLVKNNEKLQAAYQSVVEGTSQVQKAATEQRLEMVKLRQEIATLEERRTQLDRQLRLVNDDYVKTYIALRQERFTVRVGTELARKQIDAHSRPEAVRRALEELLDSAGLRAQTYGALVGSNNRAAYIISKRVVTNASNQTFGEKESIGALVESIAGSDVPVVVVAHAVSNCAVGEQVPIDITNFASTIAFRPGTVVASTTTEGRKSVEQTIETIIRFLQKDVRDSARKSGIIPRISPATGEEEVGTIEPPQLIQLVEQIRKMRGKIELRAVADTTITSGDLFTFSNSPDKRRNLRFELVRVRGK